MTELHIWQVDLNVHGPVSLLQPLRTTQLKGFRPNDPFYSDIEMYTSPFGLRATVTARAADEELAYKAAVFFFGRMLDALTLNINRPLFLNLGDRDNLRARRNDVRRVIESSEIEKAFDEARYLATNRPTFLRAMGWYRKGLSNDDPFDKFLAFWNAIETVASRYFQQLPSIDKERAKKGSKNQIWECFKALWGAESEWPIGDHQDSWISENYEVRKDIAHGVKPVDIHAVADVVSRLKTIEQVACIFLRGWRENFLHLNHQPEAMHSDVMEEGTAVQ